MSCLGNAFMYAMQVTQQTDETLRTAFTADAMSTVSIAFTLMSLQKAWMVDLQQKRNEYLKESLSGEPGSSGRAKVLQMEYENMSSQSDQQTSNWQQTLQANRSRVDEDNNSREANISLVGPNMSALHYLSNLIMKKG